MDITVNELRRNVQYKLGVLFEMKKYLILTCLICLFSISNIEANKVFTTQLNSQNTSQKNEKPVTITFRGRIVSLLLAQLMETIQ